MKKSKTIYSIICIYENEDPYASVMLCYLSGLRSPLGFLQMGLWKTIPDTKKKTYIIEKKKGSNSQAIHFVRGEIALGVFTFYKWDCE